MSGSTRSLPSSYRTSPYPGSDIVVNNLDPVMGQGPIIGANWGKFAPYVIDPVGRVRLLPEEVIVDGCVLPQSFITLVYNNTYIQPIFELSAYPQTTGVNRNLEVKDLPVVLDFVLDTEFYKKVLDMSDNWTMNVAGFITQQRSNKTGCSESARVKLDPYSQNAFTIVDIYSGTRNKNWLGPRLVVDPDKRYGAGTISITSPNSEVQYTIRVFKENDLFAEYIVPAVASFPVCAVITDRYQMKVYIIDDVLELKVEIATCVFEAGESLFLTQEQVEGKDKFRLNKIETKFVTELPDPRDVNLYLRRWRTTPDVVTPTFGPGSRG